MRRYSLKRVRNRGISTVLGILLMVGILFTSIIPMFMYINDVNNYYDSTVAAMKTFDQERGMEDLTLYAYGIEDTTKISIQIMNTGPLSANISRIWVVKKNLYKEIIYDSTNEPLSGIKFFTPDYQINPGNLTWIQGIEIRDIIYNYNESDDDFFNIFVVTTRGNRFASQTNSIQRTYVPDNPTAGIWLTWLMPYSIQVLIIRDNTGVGTYRIKVQPTGETLGETKIHTSPSNIHGSYWYEFILPNDGTYDISVWDIKGGNRSLGTIPTVILFTRPQALVKFYYDE